MSGIGGLDKNVINYNKTANSFEKLNYNHNLKFLKIVIQFFLLQQCQYQVCNFDCF